MKKVVFQVYENGKWTRTVVRKRKVSKYKEGHQAIVVMLQEPIVALKKAA